MIMTCTALHTGRLDGLNRLVVLASVSNHVWWRKVAHDKLVLVTCDSFHHLNIKASTIKR